MASTWDTLTPRHRQEIVTYVEGQIATFRGEGVEELCRYAIDGLGHSAPIADEWARGFEEGRSQGFHEGKDDAARIALEEEQRAAR
jgi:hypothetical protein